MKTIQQRVREILGNTVNVVKTLASGNLPTRENLTAIWREASGVIYSAVIKFTADDPTITADSVHNPLGATATTNRVSAGNFTIVLSDLPSFISSALDVDKLRLRVYARDLVTTAMLFQAKCSIGGGNISGDIICYDTEGISGDPELDTEVEIVFLIL